MQVKKQQEIKSGVRKGRPLASDGERQDFVVVTDPKESTLGKNMNLIRGEMKKGVVGTLPPPLVIFPARNLKLQFTLSAGVTNKNITVGNILCSMGMIASTTTNAYSMHSAVRIKSVTFWPPAGPVTSWLYWVGSGGNIPDQAKAAGVPGGITSSAAVRFTPPKGSLASFWWDSVDSSTTLFQIDVAENAIVMVEGDFTTASELPTISYTSTGLTAGVVYYGFLDGHGGSVEPVGVVSAA
jgi:hypothetical protein